MAICVGDQGGDYYRAYGGVYSPAADGSGCPTLGYWTYILTGVPEYQSIIAASHPPPPPTGDTYCGVNTTWDGSFCAGSSSGSVSGLLPDLPIADAEIIGASILLLWATAFVFRAVRLALKDVFPENPD